MKRYNRAFTLIELLVVVAIIAILVSILMPSLTMAKELAKRTSCQSNQHSVALAMQLYTSDFRDRLPAQVAGQNLSFSYVIRAVNDPYWLYSPGAYPETCPSDLGGSWLGMGLLVYTKHVKNPELFYCASQKYNYFQYPFAYETGGMTDFEFYRNAGFAYRGGDTPDTYQGSDDWVTDAEDPITTQLHVNKRAFAAIRDITIVPLNSVGPGATGYEWPHMRPSGGGVNTGWSDGHVTWSAMTYADAKRSNGIWSSGNTWPGADNYEALLWLGIEANNDFGRLRGLFPD